MPTGDAVAGRLREELPTRFGTCRVRLRPSPDVPDSTKATETLFVEFVVEDARRVLVLAARDEREPDGKTDTTDTHTEADRPWVANARHTALTVEGSGLYGVVTGETLTIRRIEDPADADCDRAVCTAAPLSRLRSVLAVVARRVRRAAAALDVQFDALRRAVEPLAHARLASRLDDAGFTERLRDSLHAAGPAADEVPFDADGRATLAAQASCLFVDALVDAAPDLEPGAVAVGDEDEPSGSTRTAWTSVVDQVRRGVDDPLFDPDVTPLADLVLRAPPPSVLGPTLVAALDAVVETVDALARSWLSLGGSTLARLFEGLMSTDRRRRWGQVYTPAPVARLLAEWTVGERERADGADDAGSADGNDDAEVDDEENDERVERGDDIVLDPACGTGRLVRAAVESRRDHGHPPPAVYGRDVFGLPVAMTSRSLPDDVIADVAVGDFFACVPPGETDSESRDEDTVDEDGVDRLPLVDAVLVNPPYTRREALDDDYVAFVRRAVEGGSSVGRRAGLAPYFLRHATSFLREGGRMGVVVGSSWLDADYGTELQAFLLDRFRIRAVVDAPRHHLVDTADVNAVLLLLERAGDPETRADNAVSFVRLRSTPETFAANGTLGTCLADAVDAVDAVDNDDRSVPDVETVRRRQGDLRQATTDDGRRRNAKWGRYLRAPPAYWTVLERRGDRFVDFHDLADAGWARLSYGTRSGAPDFFYLPNSHHDVVVDGDALRVVPRGGAGLDGPCRLPRRYWMHRVTDADGVNDPDGVNDTTGRASDVADETNDAATTGWLPNYLLKRTTGVDRLRFDVADLDLGSQLRYVIRLPEPRSELDPAARAYVEWGENHDVTACPHCRRTKPFPAYCPGEPWYDITRQLTRGAILPNKDVHATHAYWTPSTPLWVHQSLYGIDAVDPPLLAALVNSTLGLLLLEVAGRVNLGEGALDLMTGDHRSVQVPDPRRIDAVTRGRLVDRFETVASRSLGSVFEECGARRREAVSLESVRADRRALDEVVMSEVLDLSDEVQEDVYRGLVGLVDDRLTKASRER
ncbi:HsdM family class I SAM-dependent methyltransferase [Salinigranum salinum]|uniref:HsdM family class I SAM-dependent methyltransferase n=1 Tax=Salinigranum salinum TaxID=1364937 RepID=UPI0012606F50|nr:N-6 DNA methylase [Salinigranum salinum]